MLVRDTSNSAQGGPRPVFVFPARTGKWQLQIIRHLFRRDARFRDAILDCDREIRRRIDWSLAEALEHAPQGQEQKGFPSIYAWPTVVAIQIAQVELWRSRGVEPSAVVGMSGGEYAAAYAAGAYSAGETLRMPCAWVPIDKEGSAPSGGMIIVEAALEAATALPAPPSRPIRVAGEWKPGETIFSGCSEAVEEFIGVLAERGIGYKRLPGRFAYHLPVSDSTAADYLQRLAGLSGRRPVIPIYSSVSGGLLREARFDPQHWLALINGPVLAVPALRRMIQDGYGAFLEIGLGRPLVSSVREIASVLGREVVVDSSLACLIERRAPFSAGQEAPEED